MSDKITKNKVSMTKKSFVLEHKKLVKMLKSDNPKMRKAELKSQSKELKEVLAKGK